MSGSTRSATATIEAFKNDLAADGPMRAALEDWFNEKTVNYVTKTQFDDLKNQLEKMTTRFEEEVTKQVEKILAQRHAGDGESGAVQAPVINDGVSALADRMVRWEQKYAADMQQLTQAVMAEDASVTDGPTTEFDDMTVPNYSGKNAFTRMLKGLLAAKTLREALNADVAEPAPDSTPSTEQAYSRAVIKRLREELDCTNKEEKKEKITASDQIVRSHDLGQTFDASLPGSPLKLMDLTIPHTTALRSAMCVKKGEDDVYLPEVMKELTPTPIQNIINDNVITDGGNVFWAAYPVDKLVASCGEGDNPQPPGYFFTNTVRAGGQVYQAAAVYQYQGEGKWGMAVKKKGVWWANGKQIAPQDVNAEILPNTPEKCTVGVLYAKGAGKMGKNGALLTAEDCEGCNANNCSQHLLPPSNMQMLANRRAILLKDGQTFPPSAVLGLRLKEGYLEPTLLSMTIRPRGRGKKNKNKKNTATNTALKPTTATATPDTVQQDEEENEDHITQNEQLLVLQKAEAEDKEAVVVAAKRAADEAEAKAEAAGEGERENAAKEAQEAREIANKAELDAQDANNAVLKTTNGLQIAKASAAQKKREQEEKAAAAADAAAEDLLRKQDAERAKKQAEKEAKKAADDEQRARQQLQAAQANKKAADEKLKTWAQAAGGKKDNNTAQPAKQDKKQSDVKVHYKHIRQDNTVWFFRGGERVPLAPRKINVGDHEGVLGIPAYLGGEKGWNMVAMDEAGAPIPAENVHEVLYDQGYIWARLSPGGEKVPLFHDERADLIRSRPPPRIKHAPSNNKGAAGGQRAKVDRRGGGTRPRWAKGRG